jgi:hypothetical protein
MKDMRLRGKYTAKRRTHNVREEGDIISRGGSTCKRLGTLFKRITVKRRNVLFEGPVKSESSSGTPRQQGRPAVKRKKIIQEEQYPQT